MKSLHQTCQANTGKAFVESEILPKDLAFKIGGQKDYYMVPIDDIEFLTIPSTAISCSKTRQLSQPNGMFQQQPNNPFYNKESTRKTEKQSTFILNFLSQKKNNRMLRRRIPWP
jgi:hypothetical protein